MSHWLDPALGTIPCTLQSNTRPIQLPVGLGLDPQHNVGMCRTGLAYSTHSAQGMHHMQHGLLYAACLGASMDCWGPVQGICCM